MSDKISRRHLLADRIAKFINDNDLSAVYGGEVYLVGRSYHIAFSKPRVLDGIVAVYSESFIMVKFKTAYRDLPANGQFVFESEELALEFMRHAFVDLNFMGAMEVPTRMNE